MTLSRDGTKLLSPWAESDRNLMQGDERGSGRIMQELSESDKLYIQQQIVQYNHYTQLSRQSRELKGESYFAIRLNCLWRIASCAELFGDKLDPSGRLINDQWNQTLAFIEQFQGGQQ